MDVYIARHGKPDVPFAEAERSNAIRIRMPDGVVYSIMENRDGGLTVTESTHRHLSVAPRAANSLDLGSTDPMAFQVHPPNQ